MLSNITAAEMKVRREAIGVTQRQLAAAIGYTRSGVSHWEQEHSEIPANVQPRVAEVLDLLERLDACRMKGGGLWVDIIVDVLADRLVERDHASKHVDTAKGAVDDLRARCKLLEASNGDLQNECAMLRKRLAALELQAVPAETSGWSDAARAQFDDIEAEHEAARVAEVHAELSIPIADTVDHRDVETVRTTLLSMVCKSVAEWTERAVPVDQMLAAAQAIEILSK